MKPGPWQQEDLLGGDFPGYQAGASLKPSLRQRMRIIDVAYFPGYQAGASLKREHEHAGHERPHHFPGYQAGASLKPPVAVNCAEYPCVLPRLPSRGLIEAPSIGYGVVCLRFTSPVTKPGPH